MKDKKSIQPETKRLEGVISPFSSEKKDESESYSNDYESKEIPKKNNMMQIKHDTNRESIVSSQNTEVRRRTLASFSSKHFIVPEKIDRLQS